MSEILASPVFMVVTIVLMAIALLFVLLPLWRRDATTSRLERRRKALEELRDDLEPEDYRKRMARLDREAAESGGRKRPLRGLSVVLVVSIPLLAIFLYTQVGRPDGIAPQSGQSAELRQMLGELTSRVRKQPEDIDAWNRLGMIWKQLQQYPAAEAAFRRILYIEPDNAFARVELAETLLYASGRAELPQASRELLDAALASDPDNQKALWLSGLGAFHDGDRQRALALWTRLRDQLPAGNVRDQVEDQIAAVSGTSGTEPGNARPANPHTNPDPASRPDPAPAQPPGEGTSIGVTVTLEQALADRVTGGETVFVFARAVDGPPAPLAVKRLVASDLPARVTLSDSDSMAQGLSLSAFPRITISARISRTGDAIPASGDLQGQSDPIDTESAGEVSIVIDELID